MDYLDFLKSKVTVAPESGFDLPESELSPALKPHQRAAVLWALREMDGEPVFIKRIGSDHPDDRAWALVDVEHELCKTVDGIKAFFEFFGKSWLAYRRKPEEGSE